MLHTLNDIYFLVKLEKVYVQVVITLAVSTKLNICVSSDLVILFLYMISKEVHPKI